MLTVVCADKGSPGATSTALAIAAGWPQPPALLVEADQAGGDLSIVLTRNRQFMAGPTVATVASSARDSGAEALDAALKFTENVSVIPGFFSAENGAGMDELWQPLAAAVRSADVDVVADVGRLWSGSPTLPLIEAADVVVVLARQTAASMLHARERIRLLNTAYRDATIVPVAVSPERDGAADRAAFDLLLAAARVPVEPAAHIAWDPTGLSAIAAGHEPTSRSASRTRFARSARALATRIADYRAHDLLREVI